MPTGILIQGDGIAACACAKLLQKSSKLVSFNRSRAARGPVLLLNAGTQRLLKDVFDIEDEFFSALPCIRRRVVLWGDTPVAELPHEGRVVSERELLDRLWKQVDPSSDGVSEWTIYSNVNGVHQSFGSRIAHTATVEIKESAADACYIESLSNGWLFLLATSLIAVGGLPEELLSNSKLIAGEVRAISAITGEFPCYPRILDPLCGPGWLACGSAAMSFDPICGEGVGNAIREAILACAVIEVSDRESLLAEYSGRLLLGFLRHLETCRGFYASAQGGEWWDTELSALERGIEWTKQRLANLPKPRYRMVDFKLEAVS